MIIVTYWNMDIEKHSTTVALFTSFNYAVNWGNELTWKIILKTIIYSSWLNQDEKAAGNSMNYKTVGKLTYDQEVIARIVNLDTSS